MSNSPPTSSAGTPKLPPSRGRKWRRRLIITLTVIIVLVVIGRMLVSVLLPPVLRKVAGQFGLTAQYDKLDLYALDGDVGLWNLRFTPLAGGDPVIGTSYCRASISTLSLLRGKLNVNRVEAEDAQLLIERRSDGTLPLLQQLMAQSATPVAAPASTDKPKPLSLEAPLTIDVLRLQNGKARFRDQAVTPATDVSLLLDLLVTNIGSPTEKARVDVQLHSPEALVALYVSATGETRNNQLDADLSVKMYGLNLLPAREYLEPLGIVPVSSNLSAQMAGKLQLKVNPPAAGSKESAATDLSATLSFDNMQLASGDTPVASVRSINVNVATITPSAVRVASVDVAGIRANATRTKAGRLAFSGIELGPVTAASKPPVKKVPAVPASTSPFIVELVKFAVSDVGLTFDDASLATPANLGLNVSSLTIEHVSTDPAQASQPATLKLDATAPGIAKTISVLGKGNSSPNDLKFDIELSVMGISPKAAEPYLTQMGLRNELADGQFTTAVKGTVSFPADGSLAVSADITNIRFIDGQRELFALPQVKADDITVSADGSHIKLGSIAIDGPTVPVERDAIGRFSVMGIRQGETVLATSPTTQPVTTKPATAAATSPSAPPAVPAIEIGKFVWHGANVVLNDLSPKDPLKLSVRNIDVELEHLVIEPAATDLQPGRLHVAASAPGVVEKFTLDGKYMPASGAITFDLAGKTTGITGKELNPILAAAGIQAAMNDGQLLFAVRGSARNADNRMSADLTVSDVSLTDGQTRWLALKSLQIGNATFDGKVASVDSVQIDEPAARVTRNADGELSLAGITLVAPPVAAPVASGPIAESGPTRVDLTLPVIARLKSFKLNNAAVQWQDAAVAPAAAINAKVTVTASSIAVGEDVAAAPFKVAVSIGGVIDSLDITGHFKLAPHAQQVDLVATGEGIYGQSLEPYLPPNARVDFNNGSLRASLSASVSPNDAGGTKATLVVTNVSLSDGLAKNPIAGLKSIRLDIDRVDLQKRQIAINEVSVEGIHAAVTQDEQGVSLFGLTMTPKPIRHAPPARKATAEPMATTQPTDVNRLLLESKEKPPLITLKKLLVQADRLSFASPAMARELALTNLTLKNTAPIELLGDDPAQRPAMDLQLSAAVEQLVDSIAVNAHLAPLATEPMAKVDLNVTGIRANELSTLLPQLKETIDGADLSNGQFVSSADARFKFTRRGPTGIDFTRDITTDLTITKTSLSQNGSAEAFAGVNEIRAEGARFSPASGSVVIKSIDIDRPMGRIVRDAAGIHAFGLTIKNPATRPSTQPTTAPVATTAPATAPAVAEAPPTSQPAGAPAAEFRVDRFRVTGVDLLFADKLGDEPTVIPINALDIDVKGLSTAALVEPKPIKFSAIVGAGKVTLPSREPAKSGPTEERPAFSEISATGNLTLVPQPKGYVKFSMSGLEMSAVRGLASQAKVKIDRGTYDFRADVRMEGVKDIEARLYNTFNDLRLSEPPDGPIQKLLNLKAPVDSVIATLEQSDGSISLPVVVPLQAGKLDTGTVISSAAGSVGRVIADAVLAAPAKALNILIGGADDRTKAIPPVTIDFAAGESQITDEQQKSLKAVLDLLQKDPSLVVTIQHTLGTDDVALANQRTNPMAADTLELAASLRERKADLQRSQAERSTAAQVAIASQNPAEMEMTLTALRANSIELKEVDDGLEQVLSLLQPGAERQADRRTKAGAILLGDLRLRGIQQALLQSNLKAIADRVRKANAQFNPDSATGKVIITLAPAAKK